MRRFTSVISAIVLLQGCQKSAEPVKIEAWERFQQPYFKVSFSYPKGWHVVGEGGKMSLYSSQEAVEKFIDPTTPGKMGLELLVAYEKLDKIQSLEEYAASWKSDLTSSGYTLGAEATAAIDGLPAAQVEYSGRIDENIKLSGVRAMTMKDSVLYTIQYRSFNEQFAANRSLFDTLLASVRLAQPKIASADVTKPSEEFTQFSNEFLQISHPGNFETTFPPLKGGAQFSLELKGYREDCTIRIDVLPAKGLTVEKVVEQNLKFFKTTSRGSSTIDGTKAMYLNYSPAKSIASRAYFLVKNDRVYRMIINYYQPLKNDYLPAFEKTIASVRVK